MAGPKILGQYAGSGASLPSSSTAYTATANGAVISSICLVNTNLTATGTARVRVAPAAATESALHTLIPDYEVRPGDLTTLVIGVTLAAGDRVLVAAKAGVNIHVYGTEI